MGWIKRKLVEFSTKRQIPPPLVEKKWKRKMIFAPWDEFCMIWVLWHCVLKWSLGKIQKLICVFFFFLKIRPCSPPLLKNSTIFFNPSLNLSKPSFASAFCMFDIDPLGLCLREDYVWESVKWLKTKRRQNTKQIIMTPAHRPSFFWPPTPS